MKLEPLTKESSRNDLQMVAKDYFSLLILFSRFLATVAFSRAPVTSAGMRRQKDCKRTKFQVNQDALKGDTCPK